MVDNDLIEEVDGGATPWVSPIVVAPKPISPNEVRICVDMREPNRAKTVIPVLDKMFSMFGCPVTRKVTTVLP